jgi:hypothetical protein
MLQILDVEIAYKRRLMTLISVIKITQFYYLNTAPKFHQKPLEKIYNLNKAFRIFPPTHSDVMVVEAVPNQ